MTFVPYTPTGIAQYGEGVGTLRSNGGDVGGGSETIVTKSEPADQGVLAEDGSWHLPVIGTLTTAFGEKNYSNHQEVSQGSILVQPAPEGFRASSHGTFAEGVGPLSARYGKDGKDGLVVDSDPDLYRMQAFGQYEDDGTASAMKARDWKDATDLVISEAAG